MNVMPMKAADFASDQEVRWCPGCGDYAILKAVRQALAEIGRAPHEVVFVSGIGCAARFPYYLTTYGFHTIHGRAPAIATGVKLARPELDVWVVGGDGDFLAIGGNHTLHAIRRDLDLNLLLFNNAIYGLTKGQVSPTSPIGTRSPSSPDGSHERPVNPVLLALGAGARFVARSVDTMQKHLPEVLKRAHAHKGTALVEILQNCIVYHDGAFGPLGDKASAPDAAIELIHGEPMVFGRDRDRGLLFDAARGRFETVGVADHGIEALARHDETNLAQALALAQLQAPAPVGVLYAAPTSPAPLPRPKPSWTRSELAAIL